MNPPVWQPDRRKSDSGKHGGDATARVRSPLADAFAGLAPTRATSCQRCGEATLSFANGRTRLDICEACGTLETVTAEGLELFRARRH